MRSAIEIVKGGELKMRLTITQLMTILTVSQFIFVPLIQAQPIIPAADGTNTEVTPASNNSNRFNITGGTISSDNINLFHSFEQFNLSEGQIASFISNPEIQNILGRIVGGEVSVINGRIQIDSGTASLFLMNPAGFVFGNNASLHIPGDFTVTTANGIQFGENWFNATGFNDYNLLTGNPTGFAFTMTQPGAIINTGTLEANEGKNITLLGGTIVNTGSINTPQGQVNITAIPGERFVRISLPGQLLSLEVEALPNNENLPNNWNIPILALPELLTVGNSSEITEINVNDDGSLQLPDSETAVSVNSGDVLIHNTLENSGGSVNISGSNITTADINTGTENNSDGGSIQMNANDGNIVTGSLNTSSPERGGNVNLTANNQINIVGEILAESTTSSANGGEIILNAQNISIGDINSNATNLINTRNNNINFNGAVILNQNTNIRLKGDNGDLTISDILNGVESGEQTLNVQFREGEADGTLRLNGIGDTAPLESLNIENGGNIELAGEFLFINQQTFSNPIILTGDTTINSENTITFGNTVTTNVNNLTLVADEVNFGNTVTGNNNNLSIQGITSDIGIEIGGETNENQLNLTQSELNLIQGFENVIIGTIGGTEVLQVGTENPVNLQNSRFNLSLGGSGINFVNGIILPDDSTLTVSATTVNSGNNLDIEIGGENSNLILNNSGEFGSLENPIQTAVSQVEIQGSNGNIFLENNRSLGLNTLNSTTGNLNITTNGNLTANETLTGNGINLNATGNITTVDINSQSSNNEGNNITLTTGGIVSTGNLFTTGITGGNLTIQAETAITTGQINTNGSLGNGGNVILDPLGDVQVEFINSQGGNNGVGGNVFIESTGGFFRATGTFSDRNNSNTSISTAGGLGGGAVTIRHAGGSFAAPIAPFNVGNVSQNGTAGSITSGAFELSPVAAFPNSITVGNLAIITDDNPISPTPPSDPSATILGEPAMEENDNLESPLFEEPLQLSLAEKPVCAPSSAPLPEAETAFTKEFESYLNVGAGQAPSLSETCELLSRVAEIAGIKPAVIYGQFVEDQLQLVLVTQAGKFIARLPEGANREAVKEVVRNFLDNIRNGSREDYEYLLPDAQQLYQWLVEPLESELQRQKINNLVFILDESLRTLPLAALYDGKQFLIEHYSVGMMPSLSLTDTRPTNLKNSQVLAMGASEFPSEQSQTPLEFSRQEIASIQQLPGNPWQPKIFFGNEFTKTNLEQQQPRFGIIHLSTHANFSPNSAEKTYIQLYDSKLNLSNVSRLDWNNVKLLILSACKTAIGDTEAELGFAGLAFQTGAKSVVASLWSVSDGGTLPLMQTFYQQLAEAPTQAEALRQAQLAMLNKEINRDNLPEEIAISEQLNHPFYWAAFTVVGSPW